MAWAVDSPHKHSYHAAKYPQGGLDSNYCRNPGNNKTIWCYTTDPKKRWDWCEPIKGETASSSTIIAW
jgi:hypothetical protein